MSSDPKTHRNAYAAAACIALACAAGAAPAAAENDAVKDTFKKTERGFGELLKGMGQELKKVGDAVAGSAKKADKKAPKSAEKKEN